MDYKTLTIDTVPEGLSLDKLVMVLDSLGVYNTHKPYSKTIGDKTTWHVKEMTYNATMLSTHRPLIDYLIGVAK